MSRRSILSAELPHDEKTRWQAYCRARNLTPSAAVRQIVAQLLAKQDGISGAGGQLEEQPDTTRLRLELRLTQSELDAVKEIARTTGESPSHWVRSLVRAYITRQPQFGMTELAVIAESNARLLAIGRNLNQIARELYRDRSGRDRVSNFPGTLAAEISFHVKAVSSAIRANIERWSVTWR